MKHKWVMLATFKVSDETVMKLNRARLKVAETLDEEPASVQLELDQDKMLTVDGPGCQVCSVDWTVGYGQECPGKPMWK